MAGLVDVIWGFPDYKKIQSNFFLISNLLYESLGHLIIVKVFNYKSIPHQIS